MAVKPIDMQTNIAQMHEVARNAHIRTEAVVEQQQGLDKESNEKSNLSRSKLEENKKAERTIIKREDKSPSRKKGEREKKDDKDKEKERDEYVLKSDNRMGQFIDVKK